MMNGVFAAMVLCSLAAGLLLGQGEAVVTALLTAASGAVTLCLSLAGGFAVWCGLMEILRRAGAVRALTRALAPLLARLFPGVQDGEAREAIAMNLSANMLGLGNAATPMGIRAMERLAQPGQTAASNAMCLFLVINASSVQLLPTTVLTLRAAAGSAAPGAVVLPTLAATAVSTLVGVAACKLLEGRA